MTKLVRVSSYTYEQLHKLAGKLQLDQGRKISLDEAIRYVLAGKKQAKKEQAGEAKTPEKTGDNFKLFSWQHKTFVPITELNTIKEKRKKKNTIIKKSKQKISEVTAAEAP